MIASVRGVVLSTALDSAVVEVGGVGLRLYTTPGTAGALRRGAEARLATTLVVREESLTLYGFADEDERDIFTQVQTVSGVGPRLALAMLAIHAPDGLRRAIGAGDIAALTKIPGIGKKGAERIILELRDKIGVPSGVSPTGARGPAVDPATVQVHEALVGLGWSSRQADDAVEAVRGRPRTGSNGSNGSEGSEGSDDSATPDGSDTVNVSAMLRAALRELGR